MKRILIIDDDVDFTSIQKEILEKAGYTAEVCHSSTEGLARAMTEPLPDLIISDLMMEHDDSGFRLCHALKKDKQTAGIPILMLTGVQKARNISFDFQAKGTREWIKADDMADKPIRPEHLLIRVRHLLGESGEASHS